MNNMEESENVIHAAKLLDREIPPFYTDEWTTLLRQGKKESKTHVKNTVVIFRLGAEWMALPTLIFKEVMEWRPFHKIPHRFNKNLLGLVNVRGRLKLAVSIQNLLEIESLSEMEPKKGYRRIFVIESSSGLSVFPVDEVKGIFAYNEMKITNVPVTVSKSTANFLKNMLLWENLMIGLIDEQLLFEGLKKVLE